MALVDEIYMKEALKQAQIAFEKNEVPVGCVITHKDQIIAKAHNQVETLKDPTAHAEMIAITQAAAGLSSKWLHDCMMYVTLEPCAMCAGALVLSRLRGLYIGASDPKTGACGSVYNLVETGPLNHKISVSRGLLEEECAGLLKDFFQAKRGK